MALSNLGEMVLLQAVTVFKVLLPRISPSSSALLFSASNAYCGGCMGCPDGCCPGPIIG